MSSSYSRELRQLGHGDALVADSLEMDRGVEAASTSRRSVATGVWRASTTSTWYSRSRWARWSISSSKGDHLVAELGVL